MQEWVKAKLDRIEELYSHTRLAKSRSRWEAIWSGRFPKDRLPYVIYPLHLNYYDDYNFPNDNEIRLRLLLDECIFHGVLDDDFIPSLFPGCRQSTIPNMFGAKEIIVGNDISCEKIIKFPEDIDALPDYTFESGTVAYQWLEREKYWLEQTEGRLPIHVTDMQGMVDAAANMWGYDELFVCAYNNTERFHRLLTKCQNAFIELWKEQEKLLGTLFIGTHLFGWTWIPNKIGASLSADSMVMVSPDFFDKHFRPHLEIVSEGLGGLILHSCGNFAQLVKNIQSIKGLRAINASQMSLAELQQAGLLPNKVAIFVSEYEDCFGQIDLIKSTSQMSQLTIHLCPSHLAEHKSTVQWSQSDWDTMRIRNKRVLRQLEL